MRGRWRWLLFPMLLALAGAAPTKTGKPRVSMELLTEQGFPIGGAQSWYQTISGLGVSNLQIRSAKGSEEMSVDRLASGEIKVVGLLKSNGSLQLPGGTFASRDTAKLKKWLTDLEDQGPAGVTQAKTVFGLLPKQLAEVQQDLSKPLRFSTKNMAASEVVQKLGRQLKQPIVLDRAAEQALRAVKLEDELIGLSAGTALAATLRPAGLALFPERPAGGQLQYRLAKAGPGEVAWPIGFKPEGAPLKVMPELFEQIPVSLEEVPLSQLVDTISQKLKLPQVWDYNALVRERIDPAAVVLNLPEKKMSYALALQKCLRQAQLQYELRVDDAGKRFLWITSVKPAPRP